MTTGGQSGAVISRDKVLVCKINDYRKFDCRDEFIQRLKNQGYLERDCYV